jgi:hypothetical protein
MLSVKVQPETCAQPVPQDSAFRLLHRALQHGLNEQFASPVGTGTDIDISAVSVPTTTHVPTVLPTASPFESDPLRSVDARLQTNAFIAVPPPAPALSVMESSTDTVNLRLQQPTVPLRIQSLLPFHTCGLWYPVLIAFVALLRCQRTGMLFLCGLFQSI